MKCLGGYSTSGSSFGKLEKSRQSKLLIQRLNKRCQTMVPASFMFPVTPFSPSNSLSSFSKQDESHENEEDGRTHEDEETSENEVAQQDDSGSNN